MPYGSGANPVISGTIPVSNWSASGNHFEANVSQNIRNFFVNGKRQEIARYPNAHQYLWLDSAKTDYLLDADISNLDSTLILNSKICIHTSQASWENSIVTNTLLDTVYLNFPTSLAAPNGYGYYFFDNINHIDTVGEWAFQTAPRRVHYFPEQGVDPNTLNCEAAAHIYGIQLGVDVCFVTIDRIRFERQAILGVNIPDDGSRYNHIINCEFIQQGQVGIQDKGQFNLFTSSIFQEIGGLGIYLLQTGGNTEISHNSFTNIGSSREAGTGKLSNQCAIFLSNVDSCHVHHNNIDSTGYCGILAGGYHHLVERNIIKNAMLHNNEGAALKIEGINPLNNAFRRNIVFGNNGNYEGTSNANFLSAGIYLALNSNADTIAENSIFNQACGIYLSSGNTNTQIRNNLVYGGSHLLSINRPDTMLNPISGLNVKGNSLFATDPSAFIIHQVDATGQFQAGDLDSNFYFQPYNANHYAERIINGNSVLMDFPTWQATGNDANTRSSFVSWTLPQNDAEAFTNQSDNTISFNLPSSQKYLQIDSTSVCNSFMQEGYTSRILINMHENCSTANGEFEDFSSIKIFPNPARTEISVLIDSRSIGEQYAIQNMQGQIVKSGSFRNLQNKIQITDLAAGVYVLKLKNGNTKRLVIE